MKHTTRTAERNERYAVALQLVPAASSIGIDSAYDWLFDELAQRTQPSMQPHGQDRESPVAQTVEEEHPAYTGKNAELTSPPGLPPAQQSQDRVGGSALATPARPRSHAVGEGQHLLRSHKPSKAGATPAPAPRPSVPAKRPQAA